MRYKIINGERIEYDNDIRDFKYKKVLSLKNKLKPEILLEYGFEKKGQNFERCLIGYLNYLVYDTNRNILVQKVSTPNFQAETENNDGEELFELIKNHNDFYSRKNIVFGIGLQELFEVQNG